MHSGDGRSGRSAQVLDDLRRLVHGIRVASSEAERSLGISGAQLFALRELAAEPGLSIRELTARTLTDQSSVSVVVSRLVAAGLVSRERAKEDARRSVLAATPKGRALLARAPEPYQARLIAALRELPAARLTRLHRDLALLTQAILPSGSEAAPLFLEEGSPAKARRPRAK